MKIKEGFLLREVAGDTVVIPSGGELDLNMMITLNETARILWERLEKGADPEELEEVLLREYDLTAAQAKKCVADFIEKLKENDFLE